MAAQHTDSGSAAYDKKKVEGLVRKNNFCDSTKSGKMWRWRVAVQAVAAHGVPVAQRKIGFGKLARVVKSDEPPQNWVRKFEKFLKVTSLRNFGFGNLARNCEKDEPPQKSDEPPQNWVRKFRAKIEK